MSEPKNQWEYDGGGLPTIGTSKESTCGIVIHPTMGSLQLEYKSLLTHLTMAYVVNPRIDSMENLSTGRLGLVHRVLPQCSLPKSRSYWTMAYHVHFLIAKTQG